MGAGASNDMIYDVFDLLVGGYVRRNVIINRMDIPMDIFELIVSYCESSMNRFRNQITSFSSKYCDTSRWKLSQNNTCITGIYTAGIIGSLFTEYTEREGNNFCVGFKDQHNKYTFDKGIHCLSLQYMNDGGNPKHARCSLGVVAFNECKGRKRAFYGHDGWPYSKQLCFYGYTGNILWDISSIITIKLNLNERDITFYKQSPNDKVSTAFAEKSISSEGAFCFLLCADPDQHYQQQFKIINEPYYSTI